MKKIVLSLTALVTIALVISVFFFKFSKTEKSENGTKTIQNSASSSTNEYTQDESRNWKERIFEFNDKNYKYDADLVKSDDSTDDSGHCAIKTISIYNQKDMSLVQTIVPEENDLFCSQGSQALTFLDANFDGLKDFQISASIGATNQFFIYYLFDSNTGKFTYSKDLGALSNPQFDKVSKTVTDFNHDSCCHHTLTKYKFENGKFIWFETDEEYDDGNFATTTVELIKDNQVVSSTTSVTKSNN